MIWDFKSLVLNMLHFGFSNKVLTIMGLFAKWVVFC